MSTESAKPPSPDAVRKRTEELAKFAQWVAKLIRSRNWFTLLLLVDVVLILFFTPGGIVAQFFEKWFSLTLPQWYGTAFWLAVGGIFLAALTLAVQTMPRLTNGEESEFKERKAIKGLRPFHFEDRKIFARLQRQKSLQECLETIINPQFRFGILLGESGCGKTSFLQAGLCPKLAEPEASDYGIYIRFSDRDPITTIREAFTKTLPLQESEVVTLDLFPLLELGAEAVSPKPLILFFDQFEQFFVHYQRKEDREPFINALGDWYVSNLPVKIVISIRDDLSARLVELQKVLGYSLAPQEVHLLEKFSPDEASKILQVVAESENIQFDSRFITQLAEQELVSREDGLISPVDLQILAWMVEGQKTSELRALMGLAGKELSEVDRVNQLLERRVNVWLGNNRNRRFLLDIWELWSIQRQKPYLIWGTKRQQKESLIAASWQRIHVVTSVITIAALIIAVFSGWLFYTPEGQMQQVRWKITNPLDSPLARVSDATATKAAVALTKDGQWQVAFQLVADHVDRSQDKADFLGQFAAVVPQQKDSNQAKAKLSKALAAAEQIDSPDYKSWALSAIAQASGQLTNMEVRQAILHDTLSAAEAANASSVLEEIAIQYAQHYAWGKALQALRNCPESVKVTALTQVLTLWAEKKNPQLIDGAVVLTLKVNGTPSNYTFDLSIHSPDLGCDQYTDWWEVLSEDGELLYRKVFKKSHVDEQPFPSSGEPINIQADQVIIVRAHMHTNDDDDTGYEAMQALKGTVKNGFKFIRLSKNFAASVAKEEPQPQKCQ
ncbi:MAG: hypothetical protein AB4426_27220 [Xenococcaceae cyanobacterium]